MVEHHQKRQKSLYAFFDKKEDRKEAASSCTWKSENGILVFNKAFHTPDVASTIKIAAFDLDETILTTSSGNRFGRDSTDWRFLYPLVPKRLGELVNSGFLLVIFTNQLGIGLDKSGVRRKIFKEKISLFAEALRLPFLLIAATAEDVNRKPCTGMWKLFVEKYASGAHICMEESFFVGDAAGRPQGWKAGRQADHASADRKFASNIGLDYFTPEEFFLGEPHSQHIPDEFIPRDILQNEHEPIKLKRPDVPELIVLIGPPVSGKSTFYQRELAHLGYEYICPEELRSKQKCIAKLQRALTNNMSAVIDNTNGTIEERKDFIVASRNFGAKKVDAFWFQVSKHLAQHLNVHRSIINNAPRLPGAVFSNFEARFEAPSKDEGFDEIVTIPFVPCFEKTEEEKLFKCFLI